MTFVGEAQVAHAALEGPSLGSTHREFDLGEVSGVVRQAVYHSWSIEPLVVAPTQLKLFATGNSSSDKDAVVNAVNKQWGIDTSNDNVADAVTLAQIARAAHLGIRCATRRQMDVVAALINPPKPAPRQRRKSCTNL